MATLRVTFLSSLVLELLSTLSVALVAVAVGLRLLGGAPGPAHGAVRAGAGARGLPAAARARRQLSRQRRGDQPPPSRCSRCSRRPPAPRGAARDVPTRRAARSASTRSPSRYPGRAGRALDGRLAAGRAGRDRRRSPGRAAAASRRCSACCSGFVAPDRRAGRGSAARDAAELDPDAWRDAAGVDAAAAAPVRRHRSPTTSRSAAPRRLRRGAGGAGAARPGRAAAPSGPAGCATPRRRARCRAVGRRAPAARAGARVPPGRAAAAARRADGQPRRRRPRTRCWRPCSGSCAGRTVILVAHRPALLALADRVVDLDRARVPA